jgi:hypothetical protein
MRTRTLLLLIPLVVVAAACPRNGDREVTPDAVAVMPPDDPGAMPAAARSVELVPLPGNDLRAEAVILPVGVQSQVTVHVFQASPNTVLTAHVMSGSCEQPGPTAVDLQPVQTDPTGTGTSRIAIDIPHAALNNGNHLVQLRRQNGRDGVPAACGQIPAYGAEAP